MRSFLDTGWTRFPFDPALMNWVTAARPLALELAQDPDQQRQWLRCGGTWYVGVNALPNTGQGTLPDGTKLQGQAIDFISNNFGDEQVNWDPAQVSVCYQGYPRPSDAETPAAYRFRLNRDAAHLDGLRKDGPDNARKLLEFHRFILGIPLVETPPDAAPFVIWEGSHDIIRAALTEALADVPVQDWSSVDLSEPYQAARRKVFETCPRVTVHAKPGEAYLAHRLSIHGVAPWPDDLDGPAEGRVIAYFRPETTVDPKDWLNAP